MNIAAHASPAIQAILRHLRICQVQADDPEAYVASVRLFDAFSNVIKVRDHLGEAHPNSCLCVLPVPFCSMEGKEETTASYGLVPEVPSDKLIVQCSFEFRDGPSVSYLDLNRCLLIAAHCCQTDVRSLLVCDF